MRPPGQLRPADVFSVPPRGSWHQGQDGETTWKGHELDSIVRKHEALLLCGDAAGPGGDCSLLGSVIACSGGLARDQDRAPNSKFAKVILNLEVGADAPPPSFLS